MPTLPVVLGFPLLLMVGYGLAYVLAGRNGDVLLGPVGFLLYLLLLSIPTGMVWLTHGSRVSESLVWDSSMRLWVPAGILLGMMLWGVQLWGLPGRTPEAGERVWVGPPGRVGFALLLVPVAGIVLAEEMVWRAYLIPALGLLASSAAFSLHHYHFGLRHVVFAFLAGLTWGGLFLLAGSLWPGVASHLVYNALAWRHMRQARASAPAAAGTA